MRVNTPAELLTLLSPLRDRQRELYKNGDMEDVSETIRELLYKNYSIINNVLVDVMWKKIEEAPHNKYVIVGAKGYPFAMEAIYPMEPSLTGIGGWCSSMSTDVGKCGALLQPQPTHFIEMPNIKDIPDVAIPNK